MNLTIVFCTSRKQPMFNWFIDSLKHQMLEEDCIDVIFVDLYCTKQECWSLNPKYEGKEYNIHILHTPPKPTVWQGEHRITSDDWWAASNARNTGICLCQTDYIMFLDDRQVLCPGWLGRVRDAAGVGVAVCGTYEKRLGISVENGMIVHMGDLDGSDSRTPQGVDHRAGVPHKNNDAPGSWWFACCCGLPLEWALRVNGYEEMMDGLGMEDVVFGSVLKNNGYKIRFDPKMKVIQDRMGFSSHTKKMDKGVSPNDKSHASLERFANRMRAAHPWNLSEIRNHVLDGGEWPSVDAFPKTDWYDGQPISEFK